MSTKENLGDKIKGKGKGKEKKYKIIRVINDIKQVIFFNLIRDDIFLGNS